MGMILPRSLWTGRFTAAAVGGTVMILTFDILWSSETTFRGMSFAGTYLNAVLAGMILALPSVVTSRWWPQILVWTMVILLLIANLMYCRTYFSWIPLESYLMAGNLRDFTASVADAVRWSDIILPAVAAVAWSIGRRLSCVVRPKSRAYLATLAAIAVISVSNALANGGMRRHIDKLSQACYYATTPAVIYTPAGPLVAEALSSSEYITDEEKDFVYYWLAEQREIQDGYPIRRWPERDNLIMIFCESLESWPIEAKTDDGKELTPYMNSLIREEGTFYAPHVVSQVGNGRSIDAQLLMLAGMMPMNSNVYSMKYSENTYPSVIKAISKQGGVNRSTLLTCDKPIVWNQALVAKAFGIDTLVDHSCWDNSESVGNPKKLSDGSFMRQSVEKLRRGDIWPEGTHVFLQWVTYSGHNPFVLPDRMKLIDIKGNYPSKMNDYMTMVNYTDHSLSVLIEYLKSRSDWKKTMVVIVGDHEGLGTYRQEWLRDKTASRILSRETCVPMIILNSPQSGRYDEPMGQIDVYPTLLDLLNLRAYGWQGMGQSVFDPRKTPVAIDSRINIVGDTAGVPAASISHLSQARRASDIIIRYNLLKDLFPDSH